MSQRGPDAFKFQKILEKDYFKPRLQKWRGFAKHKALVPILAQRSLQQAINNNSSYTRAPSKQRKVKRVIRKKNKPIIGAGGTDKSEEDAGMELRKSAIEMGLN